MGNEMGYRLKDEEMIWAFLIKHKKTLPYKIVDYAINGRNYWLRNHIDNLIEFGFEIFPHPYHV